MDHPHRTHAKDAEGRALVAVGESVSRIIINRHTFIDINSLIRWNMNGEIGWGEDQDMWSGIAGPGCGALAGDGLLVCSTEVERFWSVMPARLASRRFKHPFCF